MIDYTVKSFEEIAQAFELFASDQLACKRRVKTAKGRAECDIRADVWRDAANLLRNTTIVPAVPTDVGAV